MQKGKLEISPNIELFLLDRAWRWRSNFSWISWLANQNIEGIAKCGAFHLFPLIGDSLALRVVLIYCVAFVSLLLFFKHLVSSFEE